jgi:hypothetical protein
VLVANTQLPEDFLLERDAPRERVGRPPTTTGRLAQLDTIDRGPADIASSTATFVHYVVWSPLLDVLSISQLQ